MNKIVRIAQVCLNALAEYDNQMDSGFGLSWNSAPEWEKEDMHSNVLFLLENPLAEPKDMHKKWVDNKRLLGWKKGKEIKEDRHPNLVTYRNLPKEQKGRYAIMFGIIKTMIGQ